MRLDDRELRRTVQRGVLLLRCETNAGIGRSRCRTVRKFADACTVQRPRREKRAHPAQQFVSLLRRHRLRDCFPLAKYFSAVFLRGVSHNGRPSGTRDAILSKMESQTADFHASLPPLRSAVMRIAEGRLHGRTELGFIADTCSFHSGTGASIYFIGNIV